MNDHPALRVVSPFDALVFHDDNGTERWSARDLMGPLGYERWENFQAAIRRAKDSAANSMGDSAAQDQFRGVTKLIDAGKGAQRPVMDCHLSRYAAYLVAMNGDPAKPEIAAAQRYFAEQTRRAEVQQAHPAGGALAALNLAVQVLNEHEQRIAAHEDRIAALESRPALPAADGTGFVSVLGWCRTHGIKATSPQMAAMSRRCGRKSHEMALPVGEIADERWGIVRTYRVEVLAEVIGTGAAS